MVEVRERLAGIDCLRGLAVLTMFVDHASLHFGVMGWVRYTLTRPGLILWCVVAGCLANVGGGGWRRIQACRVRWDVLGWGCLLTVVSSWTLAGCPDALILFALSTCLVKRGGWLCVVASLVGVVQIRTWPIPWSGYQPGTVLALTLLGRLLWVPVGLDAVMPWRPRWLCWLGRHSLGLYVGHLLLLAGFSQFFQLL